MSERAVSIVERRIRELFGEVGAAVSANGGGEGRSRDRGGAAGGAEHAEGPSSTHPAAATPRPRRPPSAASISTLFSSSPLPVSELTTLYADVELDVSNLTACNSWAYPVGVTDRRARRPSARERFWLRDVILFTGGCYAAVKLSVMIRDGSLQERLHRVTDHLAGMGPTCHARPAWTKQDR